MPTGATLQIIEAYDTPNIGRYKINYNFSILAFSSFTGIAASIFTNPNPTTADVGGVPAGTTFAGDHYLQEMMDLLLYPSVTPSFSSFLISGQATQIEVGTAIAGSNTFTWTMANTADLQANSIDIDDTTNATNIASGLANDGTETVFLSSVSKTSPSSNIWTISAEDTDGNVFSRTFTVAWLYASFYGINAGTTLNAAAIVALAGSSLQQDINNSYALIGTGYGYICVPSSFSCPTGFRNSTTNISIDTAGPNEGYTSFDGAFYFSPVSVTRNGVPITYRVYRTRDTTSSVTIDVALTGGSVSTLQSVINAGNTATGSAALNGDFSATTYYSGNTPLNTILGALTGGGGGSGATTYVQPGLNITTGGTPTAPIVSTVASPTFTGITAQSVFSTSLSGGTLYSGGTELGGLMQSLVNAVATHVQPGINITTGGTPSSPIINTSLDPVFDSVSATTISATTITTDAIDAATIMSGGTNLALLIPAQQNLEQVTTQGNVTTIGLILSGASTQSPLIQFDTSPVAGGCFIFTFFDNGITTFYNFSDSYVFQSFKTGTTFSFLSDSGIVITSNPHEFLVRRGYADIAFQNLENAIVYSGVLTSDIVSQNQIWHLPDDSGIIALTSQFDGFLHLSGGTVTGGTVFTSLSATTLYSGNTELSQLLGGGQSTHVQPGSNVYTGGTANNPIVGVIGSPIFTAVTAQSISGTSISASTLYSGGTNLQNVFSPYEHTHLSSAITDGSTGGNGTADSGKVAKYNTEGQLHGSSVNSVTEAVRGTAIGTGSAMGAIALSGTGLYAQSTYGIGVIGVTSDEIAGRFFNNSSGSPAFEVYNLDATNVGPIAHFHADDGLGMEMLNDGGLQWTSPTGAATTRTNLGLGNVLNNIISLSAATTHPDHSVPYASGGTFLSDVTRFAYYPVEELLYAKVFSGRTGTFTSSINVLGPININGTSITDMFAPITRSVLPGENIYTAGTINSQVVGVIGSPVFTAVTAVNISATTFTESGVTLANKYEPRYATINRTSGTYTLVLTDDAKAVYMTGGTAQNLVVPPNAAVAFPIGTQVGVIQNGAGQVSFSAGTGVTLLSYQSHLKISGQYAGASLLKVDTNEWSLIGQLSA